MRGPQDLYTRRNPAYRKWKNAVHRRDEHTCQLCQKKQRRYLHAHHIKQKADFPELGFSVGNGITLCGRCHNWLVNKREGMFETFFLKAIAERKPVPYEVFVHLNHLFMKVDPVPCGCGCGNFTHFYRGKYKKYLDGHEAKMNFSKG